MIYLQLVATLYLILIIPMINVSKDFGSRVIFKSLPMLSCIILLVMVAKDLKLI